MDTTAPRPSFTRKELAILGSRFTLQAIEDLDADALRAACPECGAALSWGQWLELEKLDRRTSCHSCDSRFYGDGYTTSPPTEELAAELSQEGYFDRVWYHATDRADWVSEVRAAFGGNLLVHAGSKLSALSRADDLIRQGNGSTEFYLYSFRLKSTSGFLTELLEDMCEDWQITTAQQQEMTVCDLRGEGIERTRHLSSRVRGAGYYNRYELPGDISLLFQAKLIAVESVECEILDSSFDGEDEEAEY